MLPYEILEGKEGRKIVPSKPYEKRLASLNEKNFSEIYANFYLLKKNIDVSIGNYVLENNGNNDLKYRVFSLYA